MPLPAAFPPDVPAWIVSIEPEIVAALEPVVKFKLLMVNIWPSDVFKFDAPLDSVKKTLVCVPGICCVSVAPVESFAQLVEVPLSVFQFPS